MAVLCATADAFLELFHKKRSVKGQIKKVVDCMVFYKEGLENQEYVSKPATKVVGEGKSVDKREGGRRERGGYKLERAVDRGVNWS